MVPMAKASMVPWGKFINFHSANYVMIVSFNKLCTHYILCLNTEFGQKISFNRHQPDLTEFLSILILGSWPSWPSTEYSPIYLDNKD